MPAQLHKLELKTSDLREAGAWCTVNVELSPRQQFCLLFKPIRYSLTLAAWESAASAKRVDCYRFVVFQIVS